MRGQITEQYDRYELTTEQADERSKDVFSRTGFVPDGAPIFEGKIYDGSKVATRIYLGVAQINGNPQRVALKIQFLKNEDEETKLMDDFMAQNQSSRIRTAKILERQPYDESVGYGFTIMEEVNGEPIFEGLADEQGMKRWLDFYREFREKALIQPLFPASPQETSAHQVTEGRLNKWLNTVAKDQGHWTEEKAALMQRHLSQMVLDGITETEFTHGHLGTSDIKVNEAGEHIVMSQAFYKYLPRFSDTAFHIWMTLKELRGEQIISPEEAVAYCEKWRKAYLQLPHIAQDPHFNKYFASAMRERAAGALIVDLDSDRLNRKGIVDEDVKRLKAIFNAIFAEYTKVPE